MERSAGALRVLHLSPYLAPDRLGGLGQSVANLHSGLLERGVDSWVLTSGEDEKLASVPNVITCASSPAAYPLSVVGWASRLRRFDVVHCHGGEAALGILAARCIGLKPRTVVTFHGSYRAMAAAVRRRDIAGIRQRAGVRGWVFRVIKYPGHRVLDMIATRVSDLRTVVCPSLAGELGRYSIGCVVTTNGVPDIDRAPCRRVSQGSLLYVGTLDAWKRAVVLPCMLASIRRRVSEARLTIAGIDPCRALALRRAFESVGQEQSVSWAGRLSQRRMVELYRQSTALVVPSSTEGCSLAVLEALRAGLPVVGTRTGGMPEIIDEGESGFLVDVDDIDGLVQRCVELLECESSRARMGRRARDAFEARFTVNHQIEAFRRIYEELIASDPESRRAKWC